MDVPSMPRHNQNDLGIAKGVVRTRVESFNNQDYRNAGHNCSNHRKHMSTGIGNNNSSIREFVASTNSLPNVHTICRMDTPSSASEKEECANYNQRDFRNIHQTVTDVGNIKSMNKSENMTSRLPTLHTSCRKEAPSYVASRSDKTSTDAKIESKITHVFENGKLQLRWESFSNYAVKYQISVFENGNFKYTETVKRAQTCFHDLKEGTAGKEYSFNITPVDSGGDSASITYGPVKFQDPLLLLQKDSLYLPEPRGPLKIYDITDTSLNLEWEPPASYNGTLYYDVYTREFLNGTFEQCGETGPNETHFKVSLLTSGKSYEFNIFTSDGFNIKSKKPLFYGPVEMPTQQTDPPQALLGPLTYTVIADGIVKLCWLQDECRDKHITGIKIQQRPSISSTFFDAETRRKERNSCEVTSLQLDKKYHFRVAGVNKYGTVGNWLMSEFNPVLPRLGKPSSPGGLKICYTGDNDEKAYIQWKDCDTNGSLALRYIVQMKLVNENNWKTISDDVKNNSVNCPVQEMENHKKYHFRVIAENDKGSSSPSKISEEIVKKSVPSPPTNLKCSVEPKSNTVVLKWNAPKSDGGYPLLRYHIKDQLKNDDWVEVSANIHEYKSQNVFGDYFADFVIVAENEKGKSEETSISFEINKILYAADKSFTGKRKGHSDYTSKYQHGISQRYTNIKGLPNVGMTCYANCIFQILGQTPGLQQHLQLLMDRNNIDNELSVISMLIRLITALNQTDKQYYNRTVSDNLVTSLIDCICLRDESFARGEQNDCHSFMIALFNTVKDEIKNQDRSRSKNRETHKRRCKSANRFANIGSALSLPKRSLSNRRNNKYDDVDDENHTLMDEKETPLCMFEGYMSRKFSYEPCGHDEFTDQQLFTSILIPVKNLMQREWSIEDGLKLLSNTEEFGGNDVPCTLCVSDVTEKTDQQQENQTKTTKSKQIYCILPNILILQIGKFIEKGNRLEKMHRLVTYNEFLDVTETQVSKTQETKNIEKRYMLYGVALHSGSIRYGHYTAYVRQDQGIRNTTEDHGCWYKCNDSFVNRVSTEDVLNDERAFLLFYKFMSESHNSNDI